MFVERLNSKQTVFAAPELRQKCAAKSEVFSSLPKMTSHKPFLAEISNINIFHITQYFGMKVTIVISGTYGTFWHMFRVYSTTFSKAG